MPALELKLSNFPTQLKISSLGELDFDPACRNSVTRTVQLLGILLLLSQYSVAGTLTGKVVTIADGDTITVLDSTNTQHRIRLTGIDTPEMGQPFGNAAKKHMTTLVAGKMVMVEYVESDRYGRILGKVWVQPADCPNCGKTLDVNLAQLTVGLAWWYRRYAKEQSAEDRGRYEFAEYEAKAKRVGLWDQPGAIPPWDWRKGVREVGTTVTKSGCGSKRFCKQMTSCEEARHFLTQCGVTSLDGDGDGVPCEKICGG